MSQKITKLIRITEGQKRYLDSSKVHPRESYADVIGRVLPIYDVEPNTPPVKRGTRDPPLCQSKKAVSDDFFRLLSSAIADQNQEEGYIFFQKKKKKGEDKI